MSFHEFLMSFDDLLMSVDIWLCLRCFEFVATSPSLYPLRFSQPQALTSW